MRKIYFTVANFIALEISKPKLNAVIMNRQVSSISTDQVSAFVELVHSGSIRLAAETLHLSEEGLRSRLLMLEDRLGVTLYEKERGRRTSVSLTHAGRLFHRKAVQFLEQASNLAELSEPSNAVQEMRIAVSHYMANFYLGDILKRFYGDFPHITVQVTTGTEQQVISAMREEASIKIGICVCDELPKGLDYQQLLPMHWRFVAPVKHHLLGRSEVSLEELAQEPLIMFESPCPGRRRILEAFYAKGIAPRTAIEVTTTQMLLNLVEEGIGASIIPVLQDSTILRGRQIGEAAISDGIRPVEYGILSRKDSGANDPSRELLRFIMDQFAHEREPDRIAIDMNGHRSHMVG